MRRHRPASFPAADNAGYLLCPLAQWQPIAKEGYRTLNFEYLGYFAETLLKEMGEGYTVLSCQLLTEGVDPTLIGARVTGNVVFPMYSHDVTITELFGCHFLVRKELAKNVPTVEQVVDQCTLKSWF